MVQGIPQPRVVCALNINEFSSAFGQKKGSERD